MRVIFAPLAAAGFAFALVTGATELIKAEPPPSDQPTGIVWADRVYSNKHDFAAWLKSRGASYEVWAARHPAAAGVLEPRARKVAARPTSSTPARRTAAARPVHTTSGRSAVAVGLVVASALGLLGLLVMLRLGLLQLARGRLRRRPAGRRRRPRDWLPRLAPLRATTARLLASSLAAARGAVAALRRRTDSRLGADKSASAAADEPHPVHASPSVRERSKPYFGQQLALGQATVARAVASSLAASRGAWGEFEQRRAARRNGESGADYEPRRRDAIRRYAPDLAWYVTSVLVAVVVGVSIATYLN